jgi:hypothetical protein
VISGVFVGSFWSSAVSHVRRKILVILRRQVIVTDCEVLQAYLSRRVFYGGNFPLSLGRDL